MGHWGFVWLAYGLVWLGILGYLATLKLRLKKIAAELETMADSARAEESGRSSGAREKVSS
jgi:CcmD family protein